MEIKLNLSKRTLFDLLIVVQLILLIVYGISIRNLSKKVEKFLGVEGVEIEDVLAKEDTDDNPQVPSKPVATGDVVLTEEDHITGNKDSDVQVVVFSDIECPFCGRFHPSFDQAIEEFGDKVKFSFKHFPLSFHPNAKPAANAVECAGEQGKFWEYLNELYANNTNLNDSTYKKIADDLGLKRSTFDSCLSSNKYADKIAADQQAGIAAGVEGTPATFVNGELVSGAVPYATLKQAIENNL